MLARFELFNDQLFYQNNRQDLCSHFCYSLNPDGLFQLSLAQYTYLIFLIFRYALHKWHKTNATIRGILTALYTLKCTRDPLINRSLLCKNPRILQGDFQLYKYNIDVMETIALSVKCSFHFTTFIHASEQKASSVSSCTSIVFLTKLNYPYTLTFINDPTDINFDLNT